MLQVTGNNPCATLITLFLNAVMEISNSRDEKERVPRVDRLMEYLPNPEVSSLLSPHGADMMRLWDAVSLVLDVQELFEE